MATVNDSTNGENGLLGKMGGDERCGGGNVEEVTLKKGPWTAAEDTILIDYVTKHGEGNWNAVQRNTGLNRCGKSCRLRWANHLRPNLKKGAFSPEEEKLIVELHAQFGNKWARMAALLPGRTDNEIKNYWNTRIKRRQRQGLPLYSDEHDHQHPTTPTTSTTPSPCVTPTGSSPNTPKFEFFNQNNLQHQHQQQHPLSPTAPHHHSPLSSPLQHRSPHSSFSPHTFLDPSPLPLSSSSPSPLSFTFQRPAPVLCTPLRFKRYRTTPSFNFQVPSIMPYSSDPPVTTQLTDLEGFRFPLQRNSSFSQYLHQPSLLDSDRGVSSSSASSSSAFQMKLDQLPSSHFLKPPSQEQELKFDFEFNDPAFQTSSSGLLGDLLLEAQALASGQNTKKRNYLGLNEGNDHVFDGCQSFEDLPLSSFWSSSTSGPKPKEEAPDLSKFMNEDLSSLLTVIPSSNMQGQDWHNNNAPEVSNVQSSSSAMTDDNFGLDIKPIASLFPLTNTTSHNENQGCYSWDNLPGLC
ncbi:hypothetical protein VNO77_43025 [Canavalia gladiata]|uniref:Uncharacterized protein n=1 Tax=Canavalia gladiata TaxID=3824 RepID=A0AAN9JTG5_CANGL